MSAPTMPRKDRPSQAHRSRRDLVLAWLALAVMVAMLASMPLIGGNGMSYRSGVLALAGMALLLAVLTSGAVAFGLRARRLGHASGFIPAVVGGALGGFYLVLWSLSFLGHALGME
jgi:hypothetical protein